MPLAECGGFDAAAREFDGALPREQGARGCSRGTNALQYELRALLGRASRGIERDSESPTKLMLETMSRGFKSRARNHLQANRLLEFRAEVTLSAQGTATRSSSPTAKAASRPGSARRTLTWSAAAASFG